MNPNDGVAALYLGLTAEAQNDLRRRRTAYSRYLDVGKTRGVEESDHATARRARAQGERGEREAQRSRRSSSSRAVPGSGHTRSP